MHKKIFLSLLLATPCNTLLCAENALTAPQFQEALQKHQAEKGEARKNLRKSLIAAGVSFVCNPHSTNALLIRTIGKPSERNYVIGSAIVTLAAITALGSGIYCAIKGFQSLKHLASPDYPKPTENK